MVHEVPVKVIVPPVGLNVTMEFIVSVYDMLNETFGCVVGVPAIVKLQNVSVPLLVMPHAVPVNVVVPLGENVTPLFTVSMPFMLKEYIG